MARKPAARKRLGKGRGGRRRGNRGKLWVIVDSTLAAAVIGAAATLAAVHFGNSGAQAHGTGPRLEIDAVTVHPEAGSDLVTVKMRNIGGQIAFIKSAHFAVEQSAVLPICESQGYVSSSHTYGIILPPAPRPGTVRSTNVSQQEQKDSADRFAFRLGLPAGPKKGISVYSLKLTLGYDKARVPLHAGTLLVSLPSEPDSQFVWTRNDAATHLAGQGSASQIAGWSRCMVANSRSIRGMLQSRAVRSPGLAALTSGIAYCCVLAPSEPAG
jgi:hypothetical protein